MTLATFPASEPKPSWTRYFSFNTDAKVIGIQYIVLAFFFFLIGGLLAMIIRGELITPEAAVVLGNELTLRDNANLMGA